MECEPEWVSVWESGVTSFEFLSNRTWWQKTLSRECTSCNDRAICMVWFGTGVCLLLSQGEEGDQGPSGEVGAQGPPVKYFLLKCY